MTKSIPSIYYQQQLIYASLDDFNPNSALPYLHGGQFSENSAEWREAVIDFLCTNLECGLLELVHYSSFKGKDGADWLRNVLNNGYEDKGMDAEILWNALYFTGSERLVAVVSKFGMHDWTQLKSALNHELIAELTEACPLPH